jgi:3-oxoacyl-[acyl-carrier protein] reductase
MKLLEGQVAIVTGGSRGIGKAIALRLAASGAKLIINYARNAEAAEATKAEIEQAGGEAVLLQGDVADPATADSLVKAAIETWGRLDVLVNNAGIARDARIMRMKDDDWNTVIQTDLSSAFYLTRAASKPMMKARAGRIINITSVVGLTKAIAKELASRNVLVNAVAPGFIASEMTDAMTETAKQSTLDSIPLGRYGQPEEIASLVHYLATEATYVTGQVFCVDGGMAM